MSVETDAQAELRKIEEDLQTIRYRLEGVHATLPPGPAEVVQHLEVPDEMVASTHIRAVIETLLEDKILPAIQDLRNVADLGKEKA